MERLAMFSEFTYPAVDILLRILLSAVFGGFLGFERMRKLRAASIRTYMLVCVGSCMTVLTGMYLYSFTGSGDVGRIAAQVVSGVGFIGAGAIMISGYHRIKGITTAAGLWVSACMGIALGSGFYSGATFMLVVAMFIMVVVDRIQTRYQHHGKMMDLYVLFDDADCVPALLRSLSENGLFISDFEVGAPIGKCTSVSFTLKLLSGQTHSQVLEFIRSFGGVAFMEEI